MINACRTISRGLESLGSSGAFRRTTGYGCASSSVRRYQTFEFHVDDLVPPAVATIALDSGKANVLSIESLKELRMALLSLHSDPSVQALVITNKYPGIFSAGLDLKAFHNPDEASIREYWTEIQGFFTDLYGSRLAVTALIDGHAIAGGLIVAMAADHRIMNNARGSVVGLSESRIGMVLPWWMSQFAMNLVGRKHGEALATLAPMLKADEAQTIGLIEEQVSFEEDKRQTLSRIIKHQLQIPPAGYAGNKLAIRGEMVQGMKDRLPEDTDRFVANVLSDEFQTALGNYLKSLEKKKK